MWWCTSVIPALQDKGVSGVQDHPWLQREYGVSLGYTRATRDRLKRKNKATKHKTKKNWCLARLVCCWHFLFSVCLLLNWSIGLEGLPWLVPPVVQCRQQGGRVFGWVASWVPMETGSAQLGAFLAKHGCPLFSNPHMFEVEFNSHISDLFTLKSCVLRAIWCLRDYLNILIKLRGKHFLSKQKNQILPSVNKHEISMSWKLSTRSLQTKAPLNHSWILIFIWA